MPARTPPQLNGEQLPEGIQRQQDKPPYLVKDPTIRMSLSWRKRMLNNFHADVLRFSPANTLARPRWYQRTWSSRDVPK